jgi:hypothetical protein
LLYPRKFLVAAIDEIASPALLAMSATSSQKSHTDSLPYGPTLHTRAKHVDYADRLVSGHAWPRDLKNALDCARVGMADTARLDAYANMAGSRIDERFPRQFEFPGANSLNGTVGDIGLRHRSLPTAIPRSYNGQPNARRS